MVSRVAERSSAGSVVNMIVFADLTELRSLPRPALLNYLNTARRKYPSRKVSTWADPSPTLNKE